MYGKEIKEDILFPPLYIESNKNTTSTPYVENENWYKLKKLSNLLNRYTKYNVLCMHHMDMTFFYKACKFKSYFMVNPIIESKSGKEITVFEKSVSCNGIVKTKRFECIKIKWKDVDLSELSGFFCGEEAMNMQLAVDEFKGKDHCLISTNSK